MESSNGAGPLAFLKSFTLNLGAKMSGPLSVIFSALALFLRDPDTKLLFWILAGLSFLAASYFVWRTERLKVSELDSALRHEREQGVPELYTTFDQMIVGEVRESAQIFTRVFVNMSITNTRAPSIAVRFSMRITRGAIEFDVRLQAPKEIDLARQGGGKLTVMPEDFIFEKTVTPIPSGGMVRGFLGGVIVGKGADEVYVPGTKIEISFEDVRRKRHSVEYVLPENPDDSFRYLPDGSGASRVEWPKTP
jgi:hypothetical protein